MKYAAMLIAVLLTSVAVAQTRFVDNSASGTPISLAASRDAKTGDCRIVAHNTDPRPVVAVVVDFDDGTNVWQHMIHDHFFRSDDQVAMLGTDFPITISCASGHAVVMTVRFIQYNDGELWPGSDAKTVSEMAAQRKDSIAYLNQVLNAPDIKAELAKSTRAERDANGVLLTGRVAERGILRLADDPTATAKERLGNADEHFAWIK